MWERRVEIACGLAALVLFARTACRTVFVGDGGELIGAAQALGVAHPPGYPLWTVVAKVALLVPMGEPAFRTALLSAVLGAAACALAAHLALVWSGGSTAAALVAGALLATGRTFWSAATVTEVYTAHVLLVLALLWAADRVRRATDPAGLRRAILTLGCLTGVGLAHHPTIALVLPAAAVLGWRGRSRERTRPRRTMEAQPSASIGTWAGAAALALAIAALAYGSLLLRARLAPQATWNHFTGVRAWVEHVAAAAYRPFDLGWGALFLLQRWRLLLSTLGRDLGPLGIALAVAGSLVPGRMRLAVALLVALQVGFALRYGTEDADVYLLPALAALAVLAGAGAAAALARLPRWARGVATAVALVGVVLPAALRFPAMDLRKVTLAADYARDVLASVPRDGVLVADGDNVFLLAYLTRVLGERKDLTIYDRGGHVLRDLVGGPAAERALMERARQREIALAFLSWPGYEPGAGLRFRPYGLVYALEREDVPVGPDGAGDDADQVAAQASRTGDLLARTLAASYPVMRGERALFDGDPVAAERWFAQARALAGDSETVRNTLGTVYGRRGDLARAASEFEAALRVKPASPRAAANLRLVRRLAAETP